MLNKYDETGEITKKRTFNILSPDEISRGRKSAWTELEISGSVKNLSQSIFKLDFLTSLYLNNNCLTHLPREICHLQSLVCLDLSYNRLRSLPEEIGELICLKELHLKNNLLRSLPVELGRLFQLHTLTLLGNLLPAELMIYNNEPCGVQKLVNVFLESHPVNIEHPPPRQWIPIAQKSSGKISFTVMCYNVLCEKYASSAVYPYCPNWALDWSHRKKLIIEEIRAINADIVTLQEVPTDQFNSMFVPELNRLGYQGIFSPKSRARTMGEYDRKHVDGCAIFYKTDKFELAKKYLVEFNQLAIANAEGSKDMLNRVMTKDNIALAALLKTKSRLSGNEPPVEIMVATAHIHWDPEFCDVKLIQTIMMVSELKTILENEAAGKSGGSISAMSSASSERLKPPTPGHVSSLHGSASDETLISHNADSNNGDKSVQKPDCNSIPLILCGDLNSLPHSGVVEYLASGAISRQHADFKEFAETYRACLSRYTTASSVDQQGAGSFTHPFRLQQAYAENLIPYTNYTHDFKGIIDYIFFSRDGIRSLGVLGPLDSDWFLHNRVIGCPNPHIPSDHFPIAVELELDHRFVTSSNSPSSGSLVPSLKNTIGSSKPHSQYLYKTHSSPVFHPGSANRQQFNRTGMEFSPAAPEVNWGFNHIGSTQYGGLSGAAQQKNFNR